MAEKKKTMQVLDLPMANNQPGCACGPDLPLAASAPRLDQSFLSGSLATAAGEVPVVSAVWDRADLVGAIKIRLGVNRMDYRVDPGLYALGQPDEQSPVFVSANYKLSFDHLRRALAGRSAWLLVLDTKGVNVWCAAGKGTFGSEELVHRIQTSRLSEVVAHRSLIVPQLGAPGVAAHQVRRQSGFRVLYGPIQASDLPAFLDAGNKASPKMRKKTFPLRERAVLIGVELSAISKWVLILGAAVFFLSGLGRSGDVWANMIHHGSRALTALVGAVVAGAMLTPLLLPWLPGRAFALKGLVAGAMVAGLHLWAWGVPAGDVSAWIEALGWLVLAPALAAFLAMNFTGASSYTSLSGVKREMRWAVPLEVTGAATGLLLMLTARLLV